MDTTYQPRQPAGIPVGGQYATREHAEAHIGLDTPVASSQRPVFPPVPAVPTYGYFGNQERHEALMSRGYVPPTWLLAVDDPNSTENIAAWWEQKAIAAEHRDDQGTRIPQMPDDYTPSMTRGRSVEGNRRTHRMRYTGSGITLRMPSATAIKRYSRDEARGTFDVPISIRNETNGATLTGWVRVTRTGPNSWSTEGQGFGDGDANVKVSEAVSAVLEARRPTRGLAEAGDLLERHRAKLAGRGTQMTGVDSSWVSALGYSETDQVMFTRTGTGQVYGHQVSRDIYKAVMAHPSPGRAFNKMVKGNPRAQVARCESCQMVHSTARRHTCPPTVVPAAPGARSQNGLNRAVAQQIAKRRGVTPPPVHPAAAGEAASVPPAGA